MEKMCKVSDLEARYSYKSLAPWKNEIGGGVNKCLKVKDFLQYFEKTNYELSVPNRNEMRLFPLSDISESHIILEPLLVFENRKIEMMSSSNETINPFRYENLKGPWKIEVINQSTSGHFSARVDSINNKVYITSHLTGTTLDYTCTVTLTGTRVDGQGTYSASFEVIQHGKVTSFNLRIENAYSNYNSEISFQINDLVPIGYGQRLDTTIDVGEQLIIKNVDQEAYPNVVFNVIGLYDSVETEIGSNYLNLAEISYNDFAAKYSAEETRDTIYVYIRE